jgi:hypothetical protein
MGFAAYITLTLLGRVLSLDTFMGVFAQGLIARHEIEPGTCSIQRNSYLSASKLAHTTHFVNGLQQNIAIFSHFWYTY